MTFGFLWVFGNTVDEFVAGMVTVGGRNWPAHTHLLTHADDHIAEEECMISCGVGFGSFTIVR